MDANTEALRGWALRLAQALVLALIAFRAIDLLSAGPFMDETYYWMWGQHPALSYYDHPPLNAWLLGLSAWLFGHNLFALRLPVALSFIADIAALVLLARRIAPGGSYATATVLLFLTTPVFWMVTSYALPDHLLLSFCLFAIAFFHRFFADRAAGAAGRSGDLLAGALCLGLAGLAKYNAAFLGLGVGVFVLLCDRALLRQTRLWLAAGLALLLQAPAIVWNATENFASWEFILHGRHAGLRASFDGIIPLLLGVLVVISPILFWPIARFVGSRRVVAPGSGFARTTFVISSISILALSLTTLTLFHWNLVAYAAMLPFLVLYMRPRWLLALQALYGTAFAAAAFVNYAVVPITNVDGWRDEATAWSYGWSDAATAVEAARRAHGASFIATADYTTASLLGFAADDAAITSLSPHTEQYDYWFDAAAHAGENAILFGDRWRPLTKDIRARFESVSEIDAITVTRGGRSINVQHIYLGTGFKPDE